jgi:hypothetical protein
MQRPICSGDRSMDVNKTALMKCLLVFALSVSTASLGGDGHSADGCQSIYSSAARMNEARVSPRLWERGFVASLSAARSLAASGLLLELVGQPVVDCSDAAYRCMRSWTHTLAIPRAGLKLHASYQKDHVTFVVEDCLRKDGDTCSVAVISGRCVVVNRDGSCAPEKAGNVSVSKFENVDYFIYNQDFGITALGSTDRLRAAADERLAIASQLVLTSDFGILGSERFLRSQVVGHSSIGGAVEHRLDREAQLDA